MNCLLGMLIISTACNKKEDSLTPAQKEFNNFCAGGNGNMDVNINGNNWESSCVVGLYVDYGGQAGDDFDGAIYVYGFTADDGFFQNDENDYEGFLIFATVKDGQVADDEEFYMLYWDGFSVVQQGQNAEEFSVNYFESDAYAANSVLNLSISGNKVTGSFSGDLKNADETEELLISGSFEFENN